MCGGIKQMQHGIKCVVRLRFETESSQFPPQSYNCDVGEGSEFEKEEAVLVNVIGNVILNICYLVFKLSPCSKCNLFLFG